MVRVKRRYLVCELMTSEEHGKQKMRELDVYKAVCEAIVIAHGDYGMGLLKRSLNVKYHNMGTKMVFLRIKRGAQQLLQTALTFIRKIANINVSIRTLHIAGTIRSCQKFLIKYHKQNLPQWLDKCTTPEEKQRVQLSIKKACEKVDMYKYQSEAGVVTDTTDTTDT